MDRPPAAIRYVRTVARQTTRLTEMGLRSLHHAATRQCPNRPASPGRCSAPECGQAHNDRMEDLIQAVAAKQAELGRLRPRAPDGLTNLEHSHDLELTYTSNAIEGNTLSAAETTLVIEQGLTVAGKPLRDHLEAIDHYEAIRYVRSIGRQATPLAEMDIRSLHRLVMLRSRPEIAGSYADQGRYVLTDTGRHIFPSPAEVPALMGDFAAWLADAPDTPATAFTAHRRLVEIHPFNDGNGRTARLLMNLILIRGCYPPVAVRPEDRPAYLRALQTAQAGQGTETFEALLYRRLDATLDEVLAALHEAVQARSSPISS
jgi:Fic family protein